MLKRDTLITLEASIKNTLDVAGGGRITGQVLSGMKKEDGATV